ncbi:hypothetical protein HYU95_01405 [Candidatus Daviesbacteria bacterium]|nr:hypothetical protein [Candidatus Daviesbacteria bacterium]
MLTQERESGYLSTLTHSAEIRPLQPHKEVYLFPNVGRGSQLEGTGFDLRLEINRLYANYNENLKKGKSHQDALILSVSELETNIRTFIVEYIQTRTILPHVNRIEEVDGVMRVVGQNGVPVISGITAEERNGAALEASVRVEDFMTDRKSKKVINRVSVINSPGGHSGRKNEQGKTINYKTNQTVVSWTDAEGNLYGLTIVSDLNQDQSRQLSVSLGVDEALLTGESEEERVANIVKNPALFSYGRSISNPAQYVFERILAIRGNCDIRLEQKDGTVEIRTAAQTWADIERFESILAFNNVWEDYLKGLRQTIICKGDKLGIPDIQSEITRAIEEVILDITVDFLQETKPQKFSLSSDNVIYFKPFGSNFKYNDLRMSGPYYAIAASFLRTRSGCNGGGGSGVSLRGLSLGSVVSAGSGGSSEVKIGGICNECRESSFDNHYHCPDCNKKYADETNTERTSTCACGFKFGCGGSAKKEEEKQEESKVIDLPPSRFAELPKAA